MDLARQALAGRGRAVAVALVGGSLAGLALLARAHAGGDPGLWLTVRAGRGSAGPVLHTERVPGIDRDALADRADLPARFVTLQWSGFWYVAKACTCDLQIRGGAEMALSLDGVRLLHRADDLRVARVRGRARLDPGFHAVEVEYRRGAEPPLVRVSWAPAGQDLRPLSPEELYRSRASPLEMAAGAVLGRLAGVLGVGTAVVAALLLWGFAARHRRVWAIALPGLVVVYALALRFEFLTGRTWGDDAPPLAVEARHAVSRLHPPWVLEKAEVAYEGDPWSYLRLAREMVHFYDASVREPMFVFATKCFLRLLGGQNIGVAFASTAFSVLLVLATYLLGEAAFSRWVGLFAALAMAVEHEVVALAAEGWKDDAFAFFVILVTWASIRLLERPSFARAVLLGLAGGGACLTRITALSFLVPVWLYLLAEVPLRPFRRRLGIVGLGVGLSAVCLAPYLLACAVAFGDPLYSINAHTVYYRAAERAAFARPMGALAYVFGRGRALHVADTFVLGITSVPFEQRWSGFDYWMAGLGRGLSILSLLGVLVFSFSARGRFLLLVLVTSLAPFAFTWNVGGGGAWRFRLLAYPFYLLAAGVALLGGARRLRGAVRGEGIGISWREAAARAAVCGAAAALAWGSLLVLSAFRIREEIAAGSGTIEVGYPRNRLLVGAGWSPCVRLGDIPARLSGPRSTLRIPLEAGRGYTLRLRMGPFPRDQAPGQAVRVSLNGTAAGSVVLVPGERFGAYALGLPAGAVRGGWNELAFQAGESSWSDARPFGYRGRWNVAFAVWLVTVSPDSGGEPVPRTGGTP